MASTGKARQQAFRRRRQERGCHQIAVWLEADPYALLQRLMAMEQTDLSTTISNAVQLHHAILSYNTTVAQN